MMDERRVAICVWGGGMDDDDRAADPWTVADPAHLHLHASPSTRALDRD